MKSSLGRAINLKRLDQHSSIEAALENSALKKYFTSKENSLANSKERKEHSFSLDTSKVEYNSKSKEQVFLPFLNERNGVGKIINSSS
mmetsp:Transcript_42894/g.31329  ORF Transcript_42894/g.31329 Transcript_42894/m.31329 type:complete len:88 (-) Transcript_42894:116-379(-)